MKHMVEFNYSNRPIIRVMKMVGKSISIIKLTRQPINVGGCFAYLRGLLIAARVR